MENTASRQRSERSKLIQRYYERVPRELKKWPYDAVFVFCQKDKESVIIYQNYLSKEKLTSNLLIKTILFDDLELNATEDSFLDELDRFSCIFLYITKNFCHEEDGWCKFAGEKWIKEAVSKKKCTLINFSREALPHELQGLHTITSGGNYGEDFSQIRERVIPTVNDRVKKDKKCIEKIWNWINQNQLFLCQSSNDDVNQTKQTPITPTVSNEESLESEITQEKKCSPLISVQSGPGDLEELDKSSQFTDSGFCSGSSLMQEGKGDVLIITKNSDRRVKKSYDGNRSIKNYSGRQSIDSGYSSSQLETISSTESSRSSGHFSGNVKICTNSSSTVINIYTKIGKSTPKVRKNRPASHSSKCRRNNSDEELQSIIQKEEKENVRRITSLHNYGGQQRLMEEKHEDGEQNFLFKENIPFGIQESCSKSENNSSSAMTVDKENLLQEKDLDGNQKAMQKTISRKDIEDNSVTGLSNHKGLSQIVKDTKFCLELTTQHNLKNTASQHETFCKQEIEKDDDIICDKNMKKEITASKFKTRPDQTMLSLLIPDKSDPVESAKSNKSLVESNKLSTSGDTDSSENDDFVNTF